MVFDKRASSLRPHFTLAGAGHGRAPAGRTDPRSPHEMFAATHARSRRIPQRLRCAFCEQIPQRPSVHVDRSRRTESRELRACRITEQHIWWQLELAWTGMDAHQLFVHRVLAEISSLLRRRFQSGMSYWVGSVHDLKWRRERTVESSHPYLAARCRWPTPLRARFG